MERPKITIAVTGLNNTDNPGPGVPVIRALKESDSFDARIIGLAYENLEPGIYMDGIADKTYMVPYPSEGTEVLLNRVLEINKKEHINVLIPNFDAELYAFMKGADKLREAGINTFLPDLQTFEERHKANLHKFGEEHNIKVPKSKTLTSVSDIFSLKEDFEYPVMVKGKFYDAYLAYNSDQVQNHYHKIAAKWGLPIIVQEFMKGTEVNVIALGDGKGNTIGAVPMRKQYITDKGKAWGGITIDDKGLLETTKNIISETKWRGGMELEMIRTNNNEYYLIEINPRIPAWVYLAVGAGQNLPEALVKLAMGWETKTFTEYKIGKMFIRYSFDLLCDINVFERFSTAGEL